jgi:hypothetical protein
VSRCFKCGPSGHRRRRSVSHWLTSGVRLRSSLQTASMVLATPRLIDTYGRSVPSCSILAGVGSRGPGRAACAPQAHRSGRTPRRANRGAPGGFGARASVGGRVSGADHTRSLRPCAPGAITTDVGGSSDQGHRGRGVTPLPRIRPLKGRESGESRTQEAKCTDRRSTDLRSASARATEDTVSRRLSALQPQPVLLPQEEHV